MVEGKEERKLAFREAVSQQMATYGRDRDWGDVARIVREAGKTSGKRTLQGGHQR